MSIWLKSLLGGLGIESALVSLFAFGGFGPCGPSNPLGFVGLIGHVFPGMLLVGGIDRMVPAFERHGAAEMSVMILAQAAFYWLVCYLLLLWRRRLGRTDKRDLTTRWSGRERE